MEQEHKIPNWRTRDLLDNEGIGTTTTNGRVTLKTLIRTLSSEIEEMKTELATLRVTAQLAQLMGRQNYELVMKLEQENQDKEAWKALTEISRTQHESYTAYLQQHIAQQAETITKLYQENNSLWKEVYQHRRTEALLISTVNTFEQEYIVYPENTEQETIEQEDTEQIYSKEVHIESPELQERPRSH